MSQKDDLGHRGGHDAVPPLGYFVILWMLVSCWTWLMCEKVLRPSLSKLSKFLNPLIEEERTRVSAGVVLLISPELTLILGYTATADVLGTSPSHL